MDHVFRLIAAVFLSLITFTAHADFAASPTYRCYIGTRNINVTGSTAQEACTAAGQKIAASSGNASAWGKLSGTICELCGNAACASTYAKCDITAEAASCPANSVRIGGTCKCDVDHAERLNGGVYSCVPVLEADCSKNGMIWNSDLTSDRSGRAKGPYGKFADGAISCFGGPDSPAGKGCKHMFTGELGFKDDQGQDWTNGFSWAFTEKDLKDPRLKGELSCDLVDTPTPDQEPAVKPNDPSCKDGYKGSVNGVDVCIEAWTGETQGVDFGITKGPDGTTTNTKNEITCKGDQCTIKETNTVKDKDGNTIRTTTSTTSNVNRRALCAKNPKSSVCGGGEDQSGGSKGQDPAGGGGGGKGNGDADGDGNKDSFGGSCMAGFKCNGDAVMCAMAQEQHKRNCELFEKRTPELELYEKSKGKEGDVTKELPGNTTEDLGGFISHDSLIGGGSCMPDLSLVVMDRQFAIPFSQYCEYFQYLGYILVAFSLLAAVRIVGS